MTDLQYRKKKMQDKRKQTTWREFVRDIASWRPMTFSRIDSRTSRYPQTDRIDNLIASMEYEQLRDWLTEYGLVVDSEKSFFDQFANLFASVPKDMCFQMWSWENTDFADVVRGSRNVYLSNFIVYDCENVCYSMVARENCTNIFNSLMVFKNSENIFESAWVIEWFNIFYSRYIKNCSDIWFSKNLLWCHHCIWCSDLENASYCIQNKQYTKEQYMKAHKILLDQKHTFHLMFEKVKWVGKNLWSSDVDWNFVVDSESVEQGSFSYNLNDAQKIMFAGGEFGNEHFTDVFIWWAWNGSHIYGVHGTAESEHVYCSSLIVKSSDIFYSFWLDVCSFCFWCMWLKNKSYCIFNTQYEKDEWHEKVNTICAWMEKDGVLGDYFPWSMNPFYFNDTAAALIEDFTKEEIEGVWYLRRDEEIAVDIPERMEVVEVKDLGEYEEMKDGVWTIDPSILKKVIRDEEWNVYRVIKMEYDFLVKHGLPLPRKHWLKRLKGHFSR